MPEALTPNSGQENVNILALLSLGPRLRASLHQYIVIQYQYQKKCVCIYIWVGLEILVSFRILFYKGAAFSWVPTKRDPNVENYPWESSDVGEDIRQRPHPRVQCRVHPKP